MITRQTGETDAWHQACLDRVQQNRARLVNRILGNHGADAAARAIVAMVAAHPEQVTS